MAYWYPSDSSGAPTALRGRPLRYLLVTILSDAQQPLTVRELIARCGDVGVVFDDRASKIVSDALRWEMEAGRVQRLRRGVYARGHVPRSTMTWIRQRTRQTLHRLGEPRHGDWDPNSWVPGWPGWREPS